MRDGVEVDESAQSATGGHDRAGAASGAGQGRGSAGDPGPGADALLDGLFAVVDGRMRDIADGFCTQSPALGQAMREAVLMPGKRFRAMLMLLAAGRTGPIDEAVVDAACAIEMVHASSLIFDDLPCMDDARKRRGRPATHVAHGESRAILAGIALVTEANRVLATARNAGPEMRARLVEILARSLGPEGLCAGQELDLHAEKTDHGVQREQDLKTGVLFTAGLSMLALIQRMDADDAARLTAFGTELGRVFQSYDDLLDVLGDEDSTGKDAGRDASSALANGVLAVRGLDEARADYEARRAGLERLMRNHRVWSEALGDFVARVLPLHAPGSR